MSLVLDCSVTMEWCFEDEASEYGDRVLSELAEQDALVPSIWPLEIGNVLVMAERRQRLKSGESSRFLELVRGLPIYVEDVSLSRATGEVLSVAREYELSVYDAAYLELAMRAGAALATRDHALIAAADNAGVRRFE